MKQTPAQTVGPFYAIGLTCRTMNVLVADSAQAPHVNVTVFAQGMLLHAFTRIYFSDEPANEHDPILNSVKNKARRSTLIAAREERNGKPVYHFDIRLQGQNETVFFDM